MTIVNYYCITNIVISSDAKSINKTLSCYIHFNTKMEWTHGAFLRYGMQSLSSVQYTVFYQRIISYLFIFLLEHT